MRALRIFALARTIRWATVDGLVRKARAISSVVRPQTSRSVIATWASGGKAGWQQVKINAQLVVLDHSRRPMPPASLVPRLVACRRA